MTASAATATNRVHLVGSVGLPTAEEVFATCGKALGHRLKRLTDGEVGGRRQWISWQLPLLRSMPFLENADPAKGIFSPMRVREGFNPKEIEFGELGYSREARASYEDFVAARKRGEIKQGVRFMVAMPTPIAVIAPFIDPPSIGLVLPAYTRAFEKEVERICAAIPHQDLAIQWDVCIEMLAWDGGNPQMFPLPPGGKDAVIQSLAHLIGLVPKDVEAGFHLCYGDMDAEHFFSPKDAGAMVEISNRLVAASPRSINWMHMPVDKRSDDEFYRPMSGLHVPDGTELYLGVINHGDSVDTVRSRMTAAGRYVKDFGIATECGIARVRTPTLVKDLIDLHAKIVPEPKH